MLKHIKKKSQHKHQFNSTHLLSITLKSSPYFEILDLIALFALGWITLFFKVWRAKRKRNLYTALCLYIFPQCCNKDHLSIVGRGLWVFFFSALKVACAFFRREKHAFNSF